MPINDLLSRFLNSRDGAVLVFVALGMTVFIGFTALSLDMGYAYWARTKLQIAASTGALAGALDLRDDNLDGQDDTGDYRRSAVEFVNRNLGKVRSGDVLQALCGTFNPATVSVSGDAECLDVKAGNWDPDTRTFKPWDEAGYDVSTMPLDAVRVLGHRSTSTGNPLSLFLAPLIGVQSFDITVRAIAWAVGGDGASSCDLNGIVAGGWVETNSNNSYLDGYCVYGHDGFKTGSNTLFDETSTVGMYDWDVLLQGSDNIGLGEPYSQLYEADYYPELSQEVEGWIDGLLGNLPGYINDIQNVDTLPPTLTDGVAYVVDGENNADIPSDAVLNDNVIISENNVKIGSNVTATNVIFASRMELDVGSNNTFGSADFCNSGTGTVEFLALGNMEFGSNLNFFGGQIISGATTATVDLGSNEIAAYGLAIQSLFEVKLGSNLELHGCDQTFQRFVTPGTGPIVRLVD